MAQTKKTKMTFEQALERLEQIVKQIEEGQVSLEESITKYAEGVELIKRCQTVLDEAEKKIQLLAKGEKGSLTPAGDLEQTEEP